jgi:hypothetical protein
MDLAICFPTRNRVTILLQPFPGHSSYTFLSIHPYKLYIFYMYVLIQGPCPGAVITLDSMLRDREC